MEVGTCGGLELKQQLLAFMCEGLYSLGLRRNSCLASSELSCRFGKQLQIHVDVQKLYSWLKGQ